MSLTSLENKSELNCLYAESQLNDINNNKGNLINFRTPEKRRSKSLSRAYMEDLTLLQAQETIFCSLNRFYERIEDPECFLSQVQAIPTLRKFKLEKETRYAYIGTNSSEEIRKKNELLLINSQQQCEMMEMSTTKSIEEALNNYIDKKSNISKKKFNYRGLLKESIGLSGHSSNISDSALE